MSEAKEDTVEARLAALEEQLAKRDLQVAALSLDLRWTQKFLLMALSALGDETAEAFRTHFAEQRREMLERILIQFEDADPETAAWLSASLEDDFRD